MSHATLAAQVHAAFDAINLGQRLHQAGQLRAAHEQTEHALAQTRGQISFWDKLNVFSDSKAQSQAKALEQELAQRHQAHRQLRDEIDAQLKELAAQFPPIELWQHLDRCAQLARHDLQTTGLLRQDKVRQPKELKRALHAFGQRILALYVTDFDLAHLLDPLRDQALCQEIALPSSDVVRPDPELGWAPVSQAQLQGLLAGRLLEAGFFRQEALLEELHQQEKDLRQQQQEANAQVTLWASLNTFSDSPQEQRRNELAQQAMAARDKRLARDEANRMELVAFLDSYPPLFLYRQLGAALGVLEALHPARTHQILPGGEVKEVWVVAPQAVLLQAIHELRRAFLKVFPGLPMPSLLEKQSLAQHRAQSPQHKSPRNQLMRDFTQAMDRRGGQDLLAACLEHASTWHHLNHVRDEFGRKVTLLDDALFWTDSPAQEQVAIARRRAAEQHKQLKARWEELLKHAAEVATELPPLHMRDQIIAATLQTAAITTAGGCTVSDHRNRAVNHLSYLRDYIAHKYGTRGTRQQFMSDLSQVLTRLPREQQDPTDFRARSYEEILELVAGPLRGTTFREDFVRLSEITRAWQEASSGEANAKKQISFWDWVNVFSDTEAEKERDLYKERKKALGPQLQAESMRVNQQLDRALSLYPPAQIYYMIDGVIEALYAVYARRVTVTYTDGKGRTRTRTECRLYNKQAAVQTMHRWNAYLVHGFGALPDYHDALNRWTSF